MVSVLKMLCALGRFQSFFVHMRLSFGKPRMGAMVCFSSAKARHVIKKNMVEPGCIGPFRE